MQIFEGTRWRDADSFKIGSMGDARVVLAPHFSGRAFNTEGQLNRFADLALN